MIVERHSLKGYFGAELLPAFTSLFDTLCEWDDRIESENSVTYSYGGTTITIDLISGAVRLTVSIGSSSGYIYASGGLQYINFIIVKTGSSVGIFAVPGSQNESLPSGASYSSNNQIRIVLTKCMNLNTESEEKGVVFQPDGNNYIRTQVSSESNIISVATNIYLNANSLSTVLYPATCTAYPGYCPHVFIPVFQDCGYINHKVTVNGSDYYILGGTMYLLDD